MSCMERREAARHQGSKGASGLVYLWPRRFSALSEYDAVPEHMLSALAAQKDVPICDSFCSHPAQSNLSHELLSLEGHSLGTALSSFLLELVSPSAPLGSTARACWYGAGHGAVLSPPHWQDTAHQQTSLVWSGRNMRSPTESLSIPISGYKSLPRRSL